MNIIQRRRLKSSLMLLLAVAATALGFFWLIFILFDVIVNGISAIGPAFFFNDPAPVGMVGGGLRNAIVGQFLIVFAATLIGVPIGLLGGTFIAEYTRGKPYARIISILADTMVSVPSIVVGTFIYAILVKPLGHFSGWAGAVALAVIMVPVVLRTTEDMLKLVPWSQREAAFALGAPTYKVIFKVTYRGASAGILTGVLLAISRIVGETAPLLFTSFNSPYFSTDMNGPMASLTVTIFQYAMGPYAQWHAQAWAASLLIALAILALTLTGRFIIRWKYGER